ncbi:MAG TPA: dihydroneopterin aldolase [Bacteroidales bacterium]|nr:dihydroneopterin aldolase [Bacteroidales bacterium]HRW94342.1 dihydroneopterin aldolase [Bacteroidales bacterium]
MATIALHDLMFYAHHGCFEEERLIGTRFKVDVEMITDGCKAALTDSLEDAIDYSHVYELISAEMAISSLLLEHVAGRILRRLTDAFALTECRITVSKLTPSLGGEAGRASVTLTRKDLQNE